MSVFLVWDLSSGCGALNQLFSQKEMCGLGQIVPPAQHRVGGKGVTVINREGTGKELLNRHLHTNNVVLFGLLESFCARNSTCTTVLRIC